MTCALVEAHTEISCQLWTKEKGCDQEKTDASATDVMGKRWRQIIFSVAAFFLLRGIQLGLIGDVEIGRSICHFFSEDKSDRNFSFQHATTPVVLFSEVSKTPLRPGFNHPPAVWFDKEML